MWQILLFPTKAILNCDHTMDTCKSCFEMNLASELEQHGRNGCDKLACPQCNRRLNDAEIQLLATKESAEKSVVHLTKYYCQLVTNPCQVRSISATQLTLGRRQLSVVSQRRMPKWAVV